MHNYIAPTLDRTLRGQLERAVKKARTVAEQAASEALNRLAVGEARPPEYLNEAQRNLRTCLRALGRQLGDIRHEDRHQDLDNLITSVAYEHWHRMLFARYLEQNHLLMYDEYTALTLEECNELAQEPDIARDEQERRCTTGWELAGVLASKMLPQIFRVDSPVFELSFAPEHQQALTNLVMGLNTDTFHASDSLGWVYQFWQADNKERINQSEVKIGARELPAVTQLFTEPYMVSFLLDNALGAWWANKRLTEEDWLNAKSEQELRDKASIPGVPLEYLRFVQEEDAQGNKRWAPAAGTFNEWPKTLSELKTLDPSCGSGHFLVAALLMLVPMRMTLEGLTEREAVDAVLRDNIHGLELDQRCVELAAFALALTAWTYPNSGGYRALPEMQLACSGLSVKAAKEEWKQLGLNKKNLRIALDWLHQTFQHAPTLGSLINPKAAAKNITDWDELSTALNQALEAENNNDDVNHVEAAIVAQGLAKAAQLLAGEYQWVITNVPYKTSGGLVETLRDFFEKNYPEGKAALETVFVQRSLEFLTNNGVLSVVIPQNPLFLTSYKHWRKKLLLENCWHLIARLGAGAFETISGEVVKAVLVTLSNMQVNSLKIDLLNVDQSNQLLHGLDVSDFKTAAEKAKGLIDAEIESVEQAKQLKNPDTRIGFEEASDRTLLKVYSRSFQGIATADYPRFGRYIWEVPNVDLQKWVFQQSTPEITQHFDGKQSIILWEEGKGELSISPKARIQGLEAWNKKGIAISQMGRLDASLHTASSFDNNVAVIVVNDASKLVPIWCFCSSEYFYPLVELIDQKKSKTNATLVKVPFDLEHWIAVAEEQYPHGLPQPYTNDPTQWIFHGHPAGSVNWCENEKRTVEGELRTDDTVLQVAVARLLGYQWPAELDTDMELAPEQRAWVERCKVLAKHADDDGIVCLAAVRGEAPAHQRIEALLETAYGNQWTTHTRDQLLKTVGSPSIEHWLYNKFFEQHCRLFQNRPFIWHIWDGLKDGFSVLVNYHKLDRAGLERLIYTYLGDWIRTQQAGLQNGTDGAQERLAAAESLKTELEAILAGEKPYDIFVRWKPLEEQPIGWNPDLNDGVRLNIRPFMLARDVGRKDAGILRAKPNIKWNKDRGTDVESAPWYHLGLEYGGKEGDRINEHHLSLEEKRKAKE